MMSFIMIALPSCGDEDVDLSAPLSGTWVETDEDWSISYTFKKNGDLSVEEREDGYKVKGEGEWALEDDELYLSILWEGDSYKDYYRYTIVSRTSKRMEVYSHDDRETYIWKKK